MTTSTPSPNRPIRICFLGESVAAGYLYAPHLTPAQLLHSHLQLADPTTSYELTDFSRTNETLAGLLRHTQQATTLQPDFLVIFAGNNWNLLETPTVSPYFPTLAAKQRLATAVHQHGILGPIELAARQRLQAIVTTLANIQTTAHPATVIWVIPEVNLADWWSRQPVAWLPGHDTATWYHHYFQAQQQLAAAHWQTAVSTAQHMITLDGSTCPTSHRLLTQAYTGLQQPAAARTAAIAEVDSDQYALLAFMSAPRITPLEQGILRRNPFGFTTVDLPTIFAHHLQGNLPGKQLFLDYCHLTAEGMKVSMAAVTATLLHQCGHRDDRTQWQWLLPRLPEPKRTAVADATAYFGAALHTAHRLIGPKQPLLRHWCQAALAAADSIAPTMLDLVRARLLHAPIILTGTETRNQQQPAPLGQPHGWHHPHLDHAIIQAIGATLTEAGFITAADFRHLLTAAPTTADLAYPAFYHGEPLARFYRDVLPAAELDERPYYRAPWPTSSFCLLSNGRSPHHLHLTARLPLSTGTATLTLNHHPLQTIPLSTRWQHHTLTLPPHHLQPGFNHLQIRWPLPTTDGTAALQTAVHRLEQGLEADFHPVFGELFSLTSQTG